MTGRFGFSAVAASPANYLQGKTDYIPTVTRSLTTNRFRLFSTVQVVNGAHEKADENEDGDYEDDDVVSVDSKKKLESLDFKDWDMKFLRGEMEEGVLVLQPFYQRGFKWTQKQASAWIESIIRGYPCVPEVILLTIEDEDGDQKKMVFDGQQRLTSTFQFIKNERANTWGKPKGSNDEDFRLLHLPLLSQFEGMRFQDLPKEQQNAIKKFGVRCAIIPASWEMSDYIDFFKRIQGGGSPMTDQELRRALSQGPFTELLDELSKEPIVQQATDGFRSLRPGSDELQELLLRYFQYTHFGTKFAKPTLAQNGLETMKYFNREMKSWTAADISKRDLMKRSLLKSLELIVFVRSSCSRHRTQNGTTDRVSRRLRGV